MEIEGTIEAISYKTKGIKVNGKWFNVPEELLKNVQKNQKIKLILDDYGNVINLEILGYEEIIDKDIKIEALKSSIEILKMSLQYSTPYDFLPASQTKSIEDNIKYLLNLLEKTYKKILKLVK